MPVGPDHSTVQEKRYVAGFDRGSCLLHSTLHPHRHNNSAYGSFAASGGNLFASLVTGALVTLGIAGVEIGAEAAARARAKAAGTTRALLDV